MLNKTNYMKRKMMTVSLKKKLNIFTHTLIKIFHLQKRTQASFQFITMIQKTLLII